MWHGLIILGQGMRDAQFESMKNGINLGDITGRPRLAKKQKKAAVMHLVQLI